jgi:hypothetical protein
MIKSKPIGLYELDKKHSEIFHAISSYETLLANSHNSMSLVEFTQKRDFIASLGVKLSFVEWQRKNNQCVNCKDRADCYSSSDAFLTWTQA